LPLCDRVLIPIEIDFNGITPQIGRRLHPMHRRFVFPGSAHAWRNIHPPCGPARDPEDFRRPFPMRRFKQTP
jgi:hypothetical protein